MSGECSMILDVVNTEMERNENGAVTGWSKTGLSSFLCGCVCVENHHTCQDIRYSFVNWHINIPSKAPFKRGQTYTKHTLI
jgi:hypothetical protein